MRKRAFSVSELCRFYGTIIKMLFPDIEQHNKPHIHAHYQDHEASVGIDGELLARSIPMKQPKLIRAWFILHEDELYACWNKAVQNIPFGKIGPLRQKWDRQCMW